jgi:hypothetical protein
MASVKARMEYTGRRMASEKVRAEGPRPRRTTSTSKEPGEILSGGVCEGKDGGCESTDEV